jgi:hypothetical protein
MKVAPVSERERAKAKENAAIREGFMIGKVTVAKAGPKANREKQASNRKVTIFRRLNSKTAE